MPSAAEREKARRLSIEREYVQAAPIADWHKASPSERPSAIVGRVIAACTSLGWIVDEMARTDWHPPKWETDDSGRALYVDHPRRQYHLNAWLPAPWPTEGEKTLAGVNLLYVDNMKLHVKLGRTNAPTWEVATLGANQIAKFITENGIRK